MNDTASPTPSASQELPDGTPDPRRYMDRAEVGQLFGVTAAAVRRWEERHPTFPAPDVLLGSHELPGWHPDRVPEIHRWRKTLPGQGAPGRPKPHHTRIRAAAPAPASEPLPQDPAEPEVRRHPEPSLGAGWSTTYVADDSARTLWWHDERVGHVEPPGLGSTGWTAWWASGVRCTTGASGRHGTYGSRIKALRALAAEHEYQRRARTEADRVDLAAVIGPGWTLAQTETERDTGTWRVLAPDGTAAGRVHREPATGRAAWWEANTPTGIALTPTRHDTDRTGPSEAPQWASRAAAARAVAAYHDPAQDDATGPIHTPQD